MYKLVKIYNENLVRMYEGEVEFLMGLLVNDRALSRRAFMLFDSIGTCLMKQL
jgi:hypothetical protein